jgi:hypothetical protein
VDGCHPWQISEGCHFCGGKLAVALSLDLLTMARETELERLNLPSYFSSLAGVPEWQWRNVICHKVEQKRSVGVRGEKSDWPDLVIIVI